MKCAWDVAYGSNPLPINSAPAPTNVRYASDSDRSSHEFELTPLGPLAVIVGLPADCKVSHRWQN